MNHLVMLRVQGTTDKLCIQGMFCTLVEGICMYVGTDVV